MTATATDSAPRVARSTRKCAHCKRARATFRIRNAFTSSANGKVVCDSNVCWGALTSGYPAEGVQL